MKKILSAAMAVCLAFITTTMAWSGFYEAQPREIYSDGMFSDVTDSDWFSLYVKTAVNYGLIQGRGDAVFDPGGKITRGEAVKVAAVLHSLCHTGNADFPKGEPYYDVYADYLAVSGVGIPKSDYNTAITRAEFAQLIFNTLPKDVFEQINDIPDNVLYGPENGGEYTEAIYALSRAGIMIGGDMYASFMPDDMITRAEVSAIITRVLEPIRRARFTQPETIPAELIYQRSSSAVFQLETFDSTEESVRKGSGFFISSDGLAVTNNHVIVGSADVQITLDDGTTLPVLGVIAMSDEFNLAIMQIDTEGRRVNYLRIANIDEVTTGQTVYTIGNPQGLINTITEGIVQHPEREVDDWQFFQFNAPISFGSGGSPVLDSKGMVIGVASSSFSAGDKMNLAVPIYLLEKLERGELVTFRSILGLQ